VLISRGQAPDLTRGTRSHSERSLATVAPYFTHYRLTGHYKKIGGQFPRIRKTQESEAAVIYSATHIADHTIGDFQKCNGLHLAGRPKGLDFNMAVCEEFDFVVSAWAADSYDDGLTDALKVELNSDPAAER
jgi:hypothetical protein